MKKGRILFVAPHRPDRCPSQRYRFEEYISFLEQNGFSCDYSPLLDEEDDKNFYRHGHLFEKAKIFFKAKCRRAADVKRAGEYDIVFIQREGFMTGSVKYEEAFKKQGAKIIYDFDDAIWLLDISDANRRFSFLKDPGKTSKLVALGDLVFAGNAYLAAYAKQFNKNVFVIPTTIDTSVYKKAEVKKDPAKIIIGWTGSLTTIKHFEYAVPILREVKKKYGDKIQVKVIGDATYVNEELGVKGIAWSSEAEVQQLSDLDMGIMPLPHDEWTKGKCGLKGLQYMALGIPALMSPVGVNTEIVTDGVNGFLPDSTEEWLKRIDALIASPELRKKIGEAARQTVEERYSVNAWKGKYLELFVSLLEA